MKVAICYFSDTGNTGLACEYIAAGLKNADTRLFNIKKGEKPILEEFDVIGLGSPTIYMKLPKAYEEYLLGITEQPGKPVFLLSTFGAMYGASLKRLDDIARRKGFCIIGSHALNMPENYPPMISKGMSMTDKPDEKQLSEFNSFIAGLDSLLGEYGAGKAPVNSKTRTDMMNRFISSIYSEKLFKKFKDFKVDGELCTRCMYNAIKQNPLPVFDLNACQGCCSCFNHCPKGAIYTDKVKSSARYTGPGSELLSKLKCISQRD